ncbi:transcription factor Adf-1-like [Athalia rosae]|uniref:transcription factor Adf-1-like n=1 Tax=Athalia rosae TaxID=37344 RepID=UPI0020341765|nr:transcription factor Adf-1-like [Athalia rosae]XP_048509784.1 transcription factor Adf-1-like [Athalia rosae]
MIKMNKEELDRNLIILVERNRHLYNKEVAGHKDKILYNNTWASIGAKLKITSDDAIRRWKALRDRFSRLKRSKSEIPSGSSSAQSEEYSWPLYDAPQFLLPHVKSRKSIGNFASTSSQRQKFEDSPDEDDTKCEDDLEYDSDGMDVECIDDLAVKEFLLSEHQKKMLERKLEEATSQSRRPHPVQPSSSKGTIGKKKMQ